jgi:hypothetical protein
MCFGRENWRFSLNHVNFDNDRNYDTKMMSQFSRKFFTKWSTAVQLRRKWLNEHFLTSRKLFSVFTVGKNTEKSRIFILKKYIFLD